VREIERDLVRFSLSVDCENISVTASTFSLSFNSFRSFLLRTQDLPSSSSVDSREELHFRSPPPSVTQLRLQKLCFFFTSPRSAWPASSRLFLYALVDVLRSSCWPLVVRHAATCLLTFSTCCLLFGWPVRLLIARRRSISGRRRSLPPLPLYFLPGPPQQRLSRPIIRHLLLASTHLEVDRRIGRCRPSLIA